MKKVLIVPILLVLMGGFAFAFSADFAFNINQIVNSFLVDWGGSYTTDLGGDAGDVFYLKGSESYSSCDATSSLWDSNISSGSINFTLSELIETGMDLKMEIGGNDFDLNVGTSDYSFPITGLSQKVCLKAIGSADGIVKITSTDFNIVVS